jgi:(2Fe-2S) ferredoxin
MSKTRKSSFCLVGQLEGYELSKSGKVRYLRLTTAEGLQQFKLGQSSRLDLLRGVLNGLVFQGGWLEILGQQKVYPDGTFKSLKVKGLRALQDPSDFRNPETDPHNPLPGRSALPAKILICQKSSCRKRGSMAVQRSLEQELCDRQLSDQVCVKATGCLNQCSKGPILFINKTPYRNVTVKDLGKILDQHFVSCPTL